MMFGLESIGVRAKYSAHRKMHTGGGVGSVPTPADCHRVLARVWSPYFLWATFQLDPDGFEFTETSISPQAKECALTTKPSGTRRLRTSNALATLLRTAYCSALANGAPTLSRVQHDSKVAYSSAGFGWAVRKYTNTSAGRFLFFKPRRDAQNHKHAKHKPARRHSECHDSICGKTRGVYARACERVCPGSSGAQTSTSTSATVCASVCHANLAAAGPTIPVS